LGTTKGELGDARVELGETKGGLERQERCLGRQKGLGVTKWKACQGMN